MSQDIRKWEDDPALYLFTSLTAGSSHIITATSRVDTILKANKIPYSFVDTATDESARKLWARRASGKRLPGLVKEGFVIADLEQIEEWNEFGEVREAIGPLPAASTSSTSTPAAPAGSSGTPSKPTSSSTTTSQTQSQPPQHATLALRQAGSEAAAKGAARKGPAPLASESTGSSPPSDSVGLSAITSSDAASTSPPAPAPATRTHRGSSICGASVEEIRAIEEATAIKEEDEEESGEDDERPAVKAGSKPTGGPVSGEKSGKPQEQEAAEGDEAGESVED